MVSKLRPGGQPLGSSFLQTLSASTLFERVFVQELSLRNPDLLGTGLRFLGFALGGQPVGDNCCKPLRHRLCSRRGSVGAFVLQTGFVGGRFVISKLRPWCQPVGGQFLANPSGIDFAREGAWSELLFCKPVLLETGLRFLGFALGANQSGAMVANPFGIDFVREGAWSEPLFCKPVLLGGRFVISKLRPGGQPAGGSFLQTPWASTLFERVLGRSYYFANRFCWEPVCDF